MTLVADLLAVAAQAEARTGDIDAEPSRHLAVVTCMDARIDVYGLFGLKLGEAHVLRNAGGRVTDDVLRSLALSAAILGVDTVALVQHTGCRLEGVTESELEARIGADLTFFTIDDHKTALEHGEVRELSHWERPG
jgi:carbonic anhydrase